jgi:P4 family phage/plasmid primase-like protien
MSTPHPVFFDPAEVQKALGVMVASGSVFEVRILDPRRGGRGYTPRVIFGYFSDAASVPDALSALQLGGAKGIYTSLNAVDPALLARSCNKFTEVKDSPATADRDILCRRWLLVDVDPKRPAGVSASDAEKAQALERTRSIYSHLKGAGWPEPVAADSGNGHHLLYRVELAAADDTVRRCLVALDQRFSDAAVSVDTTMHNPARIVKLYGTLAAKGDHCPELGRPHRMSRILRVPQAIEVVPAQCLAALAAEARCVLSAGAGQAPGARNRRAKGGMQPWDQDRLQRFIDQYLVDCRPGPATPYDGGLKWVLEVCPFNPDHANRSAVIVRKADGTLCFRCQHEGCKNHDWKELRARYRPVTAKPQDPTNGEPTVEEDGDDGGLSEKYGPPVHTDNGGDPVAINQMYAAARFAQENLILYDPILGTFCDYHAGTGLWQNLTDPALMVQLGLALHAVLAECQATNLLRQRTQPFLLQVAGLLRGIAERADAFRRTRSIIHVANGILDLDSGTPTLREFSPDYFSRNRSEVAFVEGAECPRFLDELLRPALDEDDISLIQRYAGQCLLGMNPAQRLLLLRGTPGGGKSTLVSIIESIVGIRNVAQLRVPHLADRFELAGLVGKSLLCGKDVPGDFLNCKAASVIKALVGGDRLEAEQKNVKHRFEIRGEFNVIVTSNSHLHVRLDGDSGAWRRRLLIVDYERPPAEKPIAHLDEVLIEEEGPGILAWCVAGALRLLAELATLGRMVLTEPQSRRVDALLNESDSVRRFVGERVISTAGFDITVAELQSAYHAFCDSQGWQALSVRQFEHEISDVMMETHRVVKRTDIKRNEKSQRGFAHVRLRPDAERPHDAP